MQDRRWHRAEARAPPVVAVVAANNDEDRALGRGQEGVGRFANNESRFDPRTRVTRDQSREIVGQPARGVARAGLIGRSDGDERGVAANGLLKAELESGTSGAAGGDADGDADDDAWAARVGGRRRLFGHDGDRAVRVYRDAMTDRAQDAGEIAAAAMCPDHEQIGVPTQRDEDLGGGVVAEHGRYRDTRLPGRRRGRMGAQQSLTEFVESTQFRPAGRGGRRPVGGVHDEQRAPADPALVDCPHQRSARTNRSVDADNDSVAHTPRMTAAAARRQGRTSRSAGTS